ncbi:alkaline phosphatase family protein [Streptomyces griseoviridis]|uniref:AlkP superfamily phosphohydrolase/phosphomutase n=1 Tax=Streptomyces griseoviridis TaxID=45398 RepID=A0ABT9L9M8_STRGD|nr:alkaline phosphatase family protein [Streptomyces griseoviridis]MDP9680418.1 putative AlkP superfamily phosphohydrolase/phosphomutase [Streptomyces griseoviridis]GGT16157.1 phosphodiesterase [Streptomyces griseoviridis]
MAERALIIGLDGMPRTLLTELAAEGTLPRIGELLDEGHCAPLRAPVPEISSTSWATFLTGTNPGRHGIFGFTDLVPDADYRTHFPNLMQLRQPPLWALTAAAGGRTVCLNVPGTYPAPAADCVVVSGFVAPRMENAVTPARLLPVLRGFDYELDVEVGDVAGDPEGFLGRAVRALRARTDAMEHLLAHEPWNLGVAVITETDRVHHFLWRAVADPADPLHGAVRDFYRLVDSCVGRLVDLCRDDDELFLVSDHGFGPADRQFYVNSWLREAGYLAPLGSAPKLAAGLDARTRAFALDPARIYLHRKERFGGGGLTASEAEELAEEIAGELTALRCDGEHVGADVDGPPLVSAVFRPADLYHGPLAGHAADLLALPAPGVQLRGGWEGTALLRSDALTGTHTRENAVFYRRGAPAPRADDGVPQEPYDMVDVAPTVLASIGIRPLGLDGAVVLDVREEDRE